MSNTMFFNTSSPTEAEDNCFPTWAVNLMHKAKISCKKTINLRDLPSRHFEYFAFQANKTIHDGPFLAITIDEFKRLLLKGKEA